MSVYIIEAVGTNRVKIGCADDVEKRLNELQVGCPYPLELLMSFPGGKELEAEYHKKYKHSRVRPTGEWFFFDGAMRQLIDASQMYSEEYYDGEFGKLRVIRGVLTGIVPIWWPHEERGVDFQDAYLHIYCPQCAEPHRHKWETKHGLNDLEAKIQHCQDRQNAFSIPNEKGCHGYYVGLVKQRGVHIIEPGKEIVRPMMPRKVITI